jgi:Ceramidase
LLRRVTGYGRNTLLPRYSKLFALPAIRIKVVRRSVSSAPAVVLSILTVVSIIGLLLLPPISQDQDYHQFADQRTLLGIPNFWNVVSNLPFIAAGALGLRRFYQKPATFVLFSGFLLTGFGSSYYHWSPSDQTLFWDRLPMTLCFMAILSTAIEERVDARVGTVLLWPLLGVGFFSLLLWRWTGDLRLYVWVQFFPCLALPILFMMAPAKYTGSFYWVIAAALYALAKVFEFYDREVYSAIVVVSGHTLKHFAAASACFAILRYFQTRQPIASSRD